MPSGGLCTLPLDGGRAALNEAALRRRRRARARVGVKEGQSNIITAWRF